MDIASKRLLLKDVSMPEYVEVDFSGISVTGHEPVGMGINRIEKGEVML